MVKKTIILFLAGTALFTACKKDDAPVTKTTAQKVLGKWSINSIVSVEYNAGVGTPYTVPTTSTDYIDFRTDGKSYSSFESNKDTTTYKVINNQSIVVDTDTAQITTLTDNSFILRVKHHEGTDSSIATFNLKK